METADRVVNRARQPLETQLLGKSWLVLGKRS